MNVVLFGATDLSQLVAEALIASGMRVAGVITVPRHFGISYRRDGVENVRFADLDAWAKAHSIPTIQWTDAATTCDFIDSVGGQFGLVAGWYHMVPESVRQQLERGCAGIHASLLPQMRGGAPLNWAILTGARRTGVTLFELSDGVDDGPVYRQAEIHLGERPVITELVEEANTRSVDLVKECIPRIADGTLRPVPQSGTPSYSLQRTPEDGAIDWRQSTQAIDRLLRATSHPYPGAFTSLNGEVIRIWSAEPLGDVRVHGVPGQLWRMPNELSPCVVTGDGSLILQDATDDHGVSVIDDLARRAHQRLDALAAPGGHPRTSDLDR